MNKSWRTKVHIAAPLDAMHVNINDSYKSAVFDKATDSLTSKSSRVPSICLSIHPSIHPSIQVCFSFNSGLMYIYIYLMCV